LRASCRQALGQPRQAVFFVVNQPGASGNTGTAWSRPRRRRLHLLCRQQSLVVNPSMNPKVAYDPLKSFVAITNVGVTPNV